MAKIAARNATLGIDGTTGACVSITGYSNNVTLTYSAEAPEVTSFGATVRERMQDGIKDAELTFDCFYDNGAAGIDKLLYDKLGASTCFYFGPSGSLASAASLNAWYSCCAILSNYEMTFGLEDAGQCSGTLVARTGSLTRTNL